LIKSGELLCTKGLKKATMQNFKQGSSPLVDFSPSNSVWKKVFAALSKDNRLVLFEYETTQNGRDDRPLPVITKVMLSLDVSTLDPRAIQITHDSVTGKRYVFSPLPKTITIVVFTSFLLVSYSQVFSEHRYEREVLVSLGEF